MENNTLQFTREEERKFVDFIFDCMYENPVHADIEFTNFNLHFNGSDDLANQTWLIDKVSDYMSKGIIIPCIITMNDVGLSISNIHAAEYADQTISSIPDDTTAILPTFVDLEKALYDIFSNEPPTAIKCWGEYNIMRVYTDETNVARYAFSKADTMDPDVHYLVFYDNMAMATLSSASEKYDIVNLKDPIESLLKHEEISRNFVHCLIIALNPF